MKDKICVGPIIYRDDGKIFLMTSLKWKDKWIVPGGEKLTNETDEQALKREIKEELGIELTDIKKIGEKIKQPSNDFQDNSVRFIFIDLIAKALSTDIKPNKEIKEYGWFTVKEALELNLLDSTRDFIEKYLKLI